MIAGYKCDYCSDFTTVKVILYSHEKTCIFNPKSKHCFTCLARKDDPYVADEYTCGKFDELQKHDSGNNTIFLKIMDGERPCPIWELEK